MADEENQNASETTPEVAAPESAEPAATSAPQGPARAHWDLRVSITEKIAEKSKGLRSRLVDTLADEEVNKRAEAMLKVFRKRDEASRELNKMKKPPVKYTADGKPQEQLFEKKEVEEIKKKQQELDKLDKALDLALGEKLDFSLVKQLGA